MTVRNYSGSAAATTLTGAIGPTDTSFNVVAATNWPTTNFIVCLGQGTASEEKVLVGSRTGTTCNSVTRGIDDTTAVSHSNGESARHTFSALDAREANAHVNATTGVHGITSGLVGLTDTQTLSNKTFTAPIVNSPTLTGTATFPAGYIPESAVANLGTDLAAKAVDTAVVHLAGTETVSGAKTFTVRPVMPKATTKVLVSTNSAPFTTLTTIATTNYTFVAGHDYRISAAGCGCFSTVAGDVYVMSLLINGTQYAFARGSCGTSVIHSYAMLLPVSCVASPSNPGEIAAGTVAVNLSAARFSGTGNLTHGAGTPNLTTLLIEDLGT